MFWSYRLGLSSLQKWHCTNSYSVYCGSVGSLELISGCTCTKPWRQAATCGRLWSLTCKETAQAVWDAETHPYPYVHSGYWGYVRVIRSSTNNIHSKTIWLKKIHVRLSIFDGACLSAFGLRVTQGERRGVYCKDNHLHSLSQLGTFFFFFAAQTFRDVFFNSNLSVCQIYKTSFLFIGT